MLSHRHVYRNFCIIDVNTKPRPPTTPPPLFLPTSCRLELVALEDRPRLVTLPPRHAVLARKREPVHGLGLHLDAVARLGRGDVVTVFDSGRVEEVLVQMVDVLEDALVGRDDDVVDGGQVLCVLWQADAAGVGHNGDAEFGGHEQHGNDLVDAA